MFTPQDFEKSQAGNYMDLEVGSNKIRVMETPLTGYTYWKDKDGNIVPKGELAGKGGKPTRSKTFDGFSNEQKNAMKPFAAIIVWNYQMERIQILEVKQTTIMVMLEALALSKSWGDVTTFDIVITKTKTGTATKDVEYSVMPEPKEKLDEVIVNTYKGMKINLGALYEGENPFATDATIPTIDLNDVVPTANLDDALSSGDEA